MKIIVLFLFLFAIGVQAQSNPYVVETGNDLLRGFQACDDAKTAPNESSLVFAESYCHQAEGYILGAASVIFATAPAKFDVGGVSNKQIYDVVRKYLVDHPETRQKPSCVLILGALEEAWGKK